MSNKKQRMKNRETARKLSNLTRPAKPCLECGELTKFGHYIPSSFGEGGFWTCDKFYNEDGRRIND